MHQTRTRTAIRFGQSTTRRIAVRLFRTRLEPALRGLTVSSRASSTSAAIITSSAAEQWVLAHCRLSGPLVVWRPREQQLVPRLRSLRAIRATFARVPSFFPRRARSAPFLRTTMNAPPQLSDLSPAITCFHLSARRCALRSPPRASERTPASFHRARMRPRDSHPRGRLAFLPISEPKNKSQETGERAPPIIFSREQLPPRRNAVAEAEIAKVTTHATLIDRELAARFCRVIGLAERGELICRARGCNVALRSRWSSPARLATPRSRRHPRFRCNPVPSVGLEIDRRTGRLYRPVRSWRIAGTSPLATPTLVQETQTSCRSFRR